MAQQPPPPARPASSLEPVEEPSCDWAAAAADTIDRVVEAIRDRTTKPAILASRGLVFGLIMAILGVTALGPPVDHVDHAHHGAVGEVWITFFIPVESSSWLGAFLMTKRHPPEVGF